MFRSTVWRWLVRDVPPGMILPWWLRVFHFTLFPRCSALWLLQRDCGFNPCTACWTIHGVRFSDEIFLSMANPRNGVLYRFERKYGGTVTVTEVHDQQP